MSTKTVEPRVRKRPEPTPDTPGQASTRRRRGTSHWSQGEAWLWLTSGSLVFSVFMIFGLLALVVARGGFHFWPQSLTEIELVDGSLALGELAGEETYVPERTALSGVTGAAAENLEQVLATESGETRRSLLRTGNFDLTSNHFEWIEAWQEARRSQPAWAVILERMTWGRFYGTPVAFRLDGAVVATEPAEVWALYEAHHEDVRARRAARKTLEDDDLGRISGAVEDGRLELRQVELDRGKGSAAWNQAHEAFARIEAEAGEAYDQVVAEIDELDRENAKYQLVLRTAQGVEAEVPLAEIVRGYPANQLGTGAKLSIFLSRWWEYLSDDPREANSEGGVFPAIFGTVLMTLVMCVLVVPFGVLAALYLREYAKPGPLVTLVRIAVNNLAGVPSIVFGVFGLGFFCYLIGASLDQVLFQAQLPNPTLGKGGLLWASLTLALLTLPVVIVATEEALAAVPNSMREGSYGCGATKWQTMQKIVLPRALPGILTGAILAISRGAGEVAPLMLVGAVKLAPELPIAWEFPLMGSERSFMHLGFHIFDLGFQSQNSEAAKPMVFTTTLLLIGIVVLLNIAAMSMRARLRRKYQG